MPGLVPGISGRTEGEEGGMEGLIGEGEVEGMGGAMVVEVEGELIWEGLGGRVGGWEGGRE